MVLLIKLNYWNYICKQYLDYVYVNPGNTVYVTVARPLMFKRWMRSSDC